MTTNLNADTIDFNAIPRHKPKTDIQINHAAVAASLCALVLIAILLAPTAFSSFSSTNSVQNQSSGLYESGYTAFIE